MKPFYSIQRLFPNRNTRRKINPDLQWNYNQGSNINSKDITSKKQLAPLINCFTIYNCTNHNIFRNNRVTKVDTNPMVNNTKENEKKKTRCRAILPKLNTTIKEEKYKIKPFDIKSNKTINSVIPIVETTNTPLKYTLKSFHSLTQPGGKNDHLKENQDTLLINYKIRNFDYYHCFGVFDGHGEYGAKISNECSNFFSNYFNTVSFHNDNRYNSNKTLNIQTELTNDNYKKIKETFALSDQYIRNHYIDASFSGTSANLILIIEDMLLCANVGDSRSILVTESNTIIPLSIDNRPELSEEKERITKANGRIDRLEGMTYGPYRVWKQNEEYPGLAMSRSIGDFIAKEIGVISEPNITQYSLQQLKPKYIICATDGIWDCLTNKDVINIIKPYYISNNPSEASSTLAYKAKRTFKAINDNIYDDISVVVLFF